MEDKPFSKEELAVLKSFVTTTDGDVFVLKNLPEVIKGALFSRYSRSTKGLRRLLLDEFITNPEIGLQNTKEEAGDTDLLALQKAKDFYDRILDGYGDDSIGELGGAHVALENVSNIATKAIQDCRIGGSPLEKSSRYVWFNKRVNGDFMFLKEPKIMASKYADLYLETNRLLFKTYEAMIEPMKQFFMAKNPKDPTTPDQAYQFSIRAQACDAIRGLLPASTLTNMGVFGNGRFFEALITKLRTHPLAEMNALADNLQEELNKVLPSFVRRAQPTYPHYPATKTYLEGMRTHLAQSSKLLLPDTPVPVADEIDLVDYDRSAEEKVLASLLYPFTHQGLKQIRDTIRDLSETERRNLLREILSHRNNRRHKPPRAFENAYYTFDILTDFGVYRDLQRHRMLTQERQDLTVIHGYDMPPAIIEAGYEKLYRECMEQAAMAYATIAQEFPLEAQYVVPFAYKVRWYFTLNARGVYWLTEIRSVPQGHPNYRRIAQKMYTLAKIVHPLLFEYASFVNMERADLGRLQSEIKIAQKKIKEFNA